MAAPPRSFLVFVPENMTAEEFNSRGLALRIRQANAYYPYSKWHIGDSASDYIAHEFLREIGVDPACVTIYYRFTPPKNPHNYNIQCYPDYHERINAMLTATTHTLEPGNLFTERRIKMMHGNT